MMTGIEIVMVQGRLLMTAASIDREDRRMLVSIMCTRYHGMMERGAWGKVSFCWVNGIPVIYPSMTPLSRGEWRVAVVWHHGQGYGSSRGGGIKHCTTLGGLEEVSLLCLWFNRISKEHLHQKKGKFSFSFFTYVVSFSSSSLSELYNCGMCKYWISSQIQSWWANLSNQLRKDKRKKGKGKPPVQFLGAICVFQ